MAAAKKGATLTREYDVLSEMSRLLATQQRDVRRVAKHIAGMSTNLKYGLVENLDTVSDHIGRARKELDRAKRALKMV